MIYFDNAATTAVCKKAVFRATEMMNCYGNPSSPHRLGIDAGEKLTASRALVAKALGCEPNRIIFTSGGTEANNLAVFSHTQRNFRAGKKIITNQTEHPSVLAPIENLKKQGFEVVYIPVLNGEIDFDMLYEQSKDACLVAFMQANNQTGCVFDVKKIREVLDTCGSGAMFHCDAVQSFCKTEETKKLSVYCDTVSVSAHKIGGIKGTGALYFGERAKISGLILGGDQENGLRGGTENTVGIAAFGGALEENFEDTEKEARIKQLRERFISSSKELLGEKIGFFIPQNHIDCIVNFAIYGLKSEVCLNYLSNEGICISSSSACSARAKKNTVLPAYGLDKKYTDCALRVGFSRFNTPDEVDVLACALKGALKFGK